MQTSPQIPPPVVTPAAAAAAQVRLHDLSCVHVVTSLMSFTGVAGAG